ncbi:cysteine dioxygenase [Mycobacterium sp.]|uniref:cysteine dioxygenase n=1 Tax=Mycobacterium sp. TaxID=1785 RepID=UPI003D6C42CF
MVIANPVASRPSATWSVSTPTRLRPPDLLHATDRAAQEVLAGHYDDLLPPDGVPADQRWFARIHSDDELDLWLISWAPARATELHDHCGSLGALTVLSGSLDEFRWTGSGLRRRRLHAGDQAAFPLGWVHDLVWAPPPTPAAVLSGPTVSVHAYSPPLSAMSYYEVTDRNTLRRQRTELTDVPEA